MAIWFAVIQETDGELISLGTVIADPLPVGLTTVNLGSTPPEGGVWNPATRVFDPTPPKLPDVDRVDEFIAAMPKTQGKYTDANIRNELVQLLGPYRFRDALEARNLE